MRFPSGSESLAATTTKRQNVTYFVPHHTNHQALNIEPLLVFWLGCTNFAFSTLDPTNPTYWAEHWCAQWGSILNRQSTIDNTPAADLTHPAHAGSSTSTRTWAPAGPS